jgi:hypothetical protein
MVVGTTIVRAVEPGRMGLVHTKRERRVGILIGWRREQPAPASRRGLRNHDDLLAEGAAGLSGAVGSGDLGQGDDLAGAQLTGVGGRLVKTPPLRSR